DSLERTRAAAGPRRSAEAALDWRSSLPSPRPTAAPLPRPTPRAVARSSACAFHPADTIPICERRQAGRVDDGHSNGPALAEDFPTVLTAPSIERLLTRALRSLRTPHRRAARRAIHAAVVVIPSAALVWYVTRHVAVLTQAGQ